MRKSFNPIFHVFIFLLLVLTVFNLFFMVYISTKTPGQPYEPSPSQVESSSESPSENVSPQEKTTSSSSIRNKRTSQDQRPSWFVRSLRNVMQVILIAVVAIILDRLFGARIFKILKRRRF